MTVPGRNWTGQWPTATLYSLSRLVRNPEIWVPSSTHQPFPQCKAAIKCHEQRKNSQRKAANPALAFTTAWVPTGSFQGALPLKLETASGHLCSQHQPGAAVLGPSQMRLGNWVKHRRGCSEEAAGPEHAATQPGARIRARSREKARCLVEGGRTPGTSEHLSRGYNSVADVCREPGCGGREDTRRSN